MALNAPQSFGLYSWQRDENLARLRVFRDEMLQRVFPAFATIEQEAVAYGAAVLEGVAGDQLLWGGNAPAADYAHEAATIYRGDLDQVLSTVTVFATATLYHAHWETPVRHWLGREAPLYGASKAQMKMIEQAKLEQIAKFLGSHGWPLSDTDWFPVLQELRLVANTAKHTSGPSARDLFAIRPKLFWPANIEGYEQGFDSVVPDGTNLVIELSDFRRYAAAVESFWSSAPGADGG